MENWETRLWSSRSDVDSRLLAASERALAAVCAGFCQVRSPFSRARMNRSQIELLASTELSNLTWTSIGCHRTGTSGCSAPSPRVRACKRKAGSGTDRRPALRDHQNELRLFAIRNATRHSGITRDDHGMVRFKPGLEDQARHVLHVQYDTTIWLDKFSGT